MTKQIKEDIYRPYGVADWQATMSNAFFGKSDLALDNINGPTEWYKGSIAADEIESLKTELLPILTAMTDAKNKSENHPDSINVSIGGETTDIVNGSPVIDMFKTFVTGDLIDKVYNMRIALPDKITQLMAKYECNIKIGYIYRYVKNGNEYIRIEGGTAKNKNYVRCFSGVWDDAKSCPYNTYDAYYLSTKQSATASESISSTEFAVYCSVTGSTGAHAVVTSEWINDYDIVGGIYQRTIDRTVISLETLLETINSLKATLDGIPNAVTREMTDIKKQVQDGLSNVGTSLSVMNQAVIDVKKGVQALNVMTNSNTASITDILDKNNTDMSTALNILTGKLSIIEAFGGRADKTIADKISIAASYTGAITGIINLLKRK